ncbi:GNAT family N-acetyltransferase [Burkholderiaceae bacterium FT117]|uniref:GNAT family N-acetyltransferase n=1 Tax=Zeimonas sediminis TaxID=2944268 RepID=UPI002342E9D2|nr:GNAT family N-acetyltransferase [Zeimonas sediminis]MCM5569368.1 GNAT family N-acetyltransferase [Zeimonas sediminis]
MFEAADYRTRVVEGLSGVSCADWNALAGAACGGVPQPFLRHEFLAALESTGCVGDEAGWSPRHLLLEDSGGRLLAAVPLYLKSHSYGEYVFDWAWADAYRRHGLRYYPKLLSAVPFTPVAGPRLLAADPASRAGAARALMALARDSGLSSLHVLFPADGDATLLEDEGAMRRRGVQFHWRNRGWASFEDFLADLSQPKRKKIRAERRKVAEAGLRIERLQGEAIRPADWAFFARCYENTYAAHGSTPYLNLAFFERIGEALPRNLVLVVARDGGRPVAASLLVVDDERCYGRYWGALAHVPCLHFELCYYQAIELAIDRRLAVIEGGAQGEHKMARGFEPVETCSAHWLAEPAFAEAVDRFLAREGGLVGAYLDELDERSPFRAAGAPA